jgi:hypothetical protein
MNNFKIFLITQKLREPFCNDESKSKWRFAIYYALLKTVAPSLEIIWEDKYRQWNIDHLYRGQKNYRKRTSVILLSIHSSKIDDDHTKLTAIFRENDGSQTTESIAYNRDQFDQTLWETRNPKNIAILKGEKERDLLYKESIDSVS